jgi:hypothetical protein
MTINEKFAFCFNWYVKYQKFELNKYDNILSEIFKGSMISGSFLTYVSICKNSKSEIAFEKYKRVNSMSNITKFIDKLYLILIELNID